MTYSPPDLGKAAESSARVRAPQRATTPPTTQSASMSWLLPSFRTVCPEVVRTPTPIMLETITKVAVASPNPAPASVDRGLGRGARRRASEGPPGVIDQDGLRNGPVEVGGSRAGAVGGDRRRRRRVLG